MSHHERTSLAKNMTWKIYITIWLHCVKKGDKVNGKFQMQTVISYFSLTYRKNVISGRPQIVAALADSLVELVAALK